MQATKQRYLILPAALLVTMSLCVILAGCNPAPLANAGPDRDALIGEEIEFDGSASYDPNGIIAAYHWDFGDGTSGAGATVTHAYESVGTYTVELTVVDDGTFFRKPASHLDTATVSVGRLTLVGRVVDGSGAGVSGLPGTVSRVGTDEVYEFTTAGDGVVVIEELPPDDYLIRGHGGDSGRYVVIETTVGLSAANSDVETPIDAVGLSATGVVIESRATASASGQSHAIPSIHRGLVESVFLRTSEGSVSSATRRVRPLAADQSFLDDNVSFFLLTWRPFATDDTADYRIDMLDSAGESIGTVWSSGDSHPGDPVYNSTDPAAYLDLSGELAAFDIAPGTRWFAIVALDDGGAVLERSSPIPATIGTTLSAFPQALTAGASTLSWAPVASASGYSVQIYDETGVRVYPAGTAQPAVTTGVSVAIPEGLVTGAWYEWYVDARATGPQGWTNEITRGISGFVR